MQKIVEFVQEYENNYLLIQNMYPDHHQQQQQQQQLSSPNYNQHQLIMDPDLQVSINNIKTIIKYNIPPSINSSGVAELDNLINLLINNLQTQPPAITHRSAGIILDIIHLTAEYTALINNIANPNYLTPPINPHATNPTPAPAIPESTIQEIIKQLKETPIGISITHSPEIKSYLSNKAILVSNQDQPQNIPNPYLSKLRTTYKESISQILHRSIAESISDLNNISDADSISNQDLQELILSNMFIYSVLIPQLALNKIYYKKSPPSPPHDSLTYHHPNHQQNQQLYNQAVITFLKDYCSAYLS